MPDLISLKLFMRAAELGSLSKAASQSNVALAAISRRISNLESYYRVSLFLRTGRGVQLTPAGRVLLTRTREMMLLEGRTRADISDFAKGLRGVVTLMASTSAITQHLPHDLAKFAALCPDLRVDLQEAYTADIVGAVRDQTIEVGVVIAGPNVVDLATTPYRVDRLVVVAPHDFSPNIQRVQLLSLVKHDFVVMGDNTATTKLLQAVAADAGIILRLRIKVGSFDAVCRMVQAGFGLGVLPKMAAMHFEATMGLRMIELEDTWAERRMLICTNSQTGCSAAAKRLVAHLSDCAGDEAT
jgi:DNA-binding transcriptional LysR family regulator